MNLLEIIKALKEPAAAASAEPEWWLCAVGAAVAAVVGWFALKVLVASLRGRWFWLFGPYCIIAGGLTLILV